MRFLMLGVIVIAAGVVTGCSSRANRPPASIPETVENTPPPPVTDPVGASSEELETIPPPPPMAGEEGWTNPAPPPEAPPAAEEPVRTTRGYRVQLFAGNTRESAEAAAADARGRFPESVTITFEEPFYKVRIGNCVTRHEAERLQERAVELGYDGPFIAETAIDVR